MYEIRNCPDAQARQWCHCQYRLHYGIDIRPLQRDERGEPVDLVRAIAQGTVVHTSQVPGYSNYGKYVVVEHRWDGSSYYSLYAHLSSIQVQVGQRVEQRDPLGVMGHTGEGLNQTRAHLHLELNLMLSRQFEAWHDSLFTRDPNRHGLYNGLNLVGLDVARLYLALKEKPSLTISEFLSQEETVYRVLFPDSGALRPATVLSVDAHPKRRDTTWLVGSLIQPRRGSATNRA